MPRGFQQLLSGSQGGVPNPSPAARPVAFRELQAGNLDEIKLMEKQLEELAPLADAGDPRAMGQYSAIMQRIREKEARQHQMYLREHQAGGIVGGYGEAQSQVEERKRFKQVTPPGSVGAPILP